MRRMGAVRALAGHHQRRRSRVSKPSRAYESALLVPCERGGGVCSSNARVANAGLDQIRWVLCRRLEISLSQGAEWNALISTYITTMPFRGDACCAAEQSMSGGPAKKTPVNSAMMAKTGDAARASPLAAPIAAAFRRVARPLYLPQQAWLMTSCSRPGSALPPLPHPKSRPISCRARRLRHSCRASSTTCTSGSGDSLRANPPRPPAGPAA